MIRRHPSVVAHQARNRPRGQSVLLRLVAVERFHMEVQRREDIQRRRRAVCEELSRLSEAPETPVSSCFWVNDSDAVPAYYSFCEGCIDKALEVANADWQKTGGDEWYEPTWGMGTDEGESPRCCDGEEILNNGCYQLVETWVTDPRGELEHFRDIKEYSDGLRAELRMALEGLLELSDITAQDVLFARQCVTWALSRDVFSTKKLP